MYEIYQIVGKVLVEACRVVFTNHDEGHIQKNNYSLQNINTKNNFLLFHTI